MDSILSIVENVQKNVFSHFNSSSDIEQKERIASDANQFYSRISTEEGVQNMMTKFRLQLFSIKEVNEEIIRRANMCSTRMGRVQQNLTECAKQMERLDQLLRPSQMANFSGILDEVGRQMRDLERHGLQAELAMAELERLANGGGTNDRDGDGRGRGADGAAGGSAEEQLLTI